MKSETKKRISEIVWPIIYFFLVITICFSGCLVFRRYYYSSVFVSGQSMAPTLKGGIGNGDRGEAHFGLVDTSEYAKKRIKRFDIITTYYPWDSNDYEEYKLGQTKLDGSQPERKIKRVLAKPGETITVIGEKGDILISSNAFYVNRFEQHTDFKFGTIDDRDLEYHNHYVSNFSSNGFSITESYLDAKNFMLEESNDGGYYISLETEASSYRYLTVTTSGNNHTLSADMSAATVWKYSDELKTFFTEISNHKDSTLDGRYVFGTNTADKKIVLTKAEKLSEENLFVSRFISRDDSKNILFTKDLLPKENDYKFPFKNELLPFSRQFDNKGYNCKNFVDVVLKDGRYWVQGDHWANSTDCFGNGPIYYENIEGKLVIIEGTCTILKTEDNQKICSNHKFGNPIYL